MHTANASYIQEGHLYGHRSCCGALVSITDVFAKMHVRSGYMTDSINRERRQECPSQCTYFKIAKQKYIQYNYYEIKE